MGGYMFMVLPLMKWYTSIDEMVLPLMVLPLLALDWSGGGGGVNRRLKLGKYRMLKCFYSAENPVQGDSKNNSCRWRYIVTSSKMLVFLNQCSQENFRGLQKAYKFINFPFLHRFAIYFWFFECIWTCIRALKYIVKLDSHQTMILSAILKYKSVTVIWEGVRGIPPPQIYRKGGAAKWLKKKKTTDCVNFFFFFTHSSFFNLYLFNF